MAKYKHGDNIHEHSKTNESYRRILTLSQRLNLRSSNKLLKKPLQKLSIYYTWKYLTKQYNHNKLKIVAPTYNNNFELQNGSYSVSDIQDCIKYIFKKLEILTIIPPIYGYINIIDNSIFINSIFINN